MIRRTVTAVLIVTVCAARAEARRAVERVASELSGAPELLRGFKASAVVRETTAA